MNKTICIYHGNCADGFGAAWVVWKHFKNRASITFPGVNDVEFYPGVYQKPPPDCAEKNVIIVDFSYPPNAMEKIYYECNSLTWIDHHKSAIEAMDGFFRTLNVKWDSRFDKLLDMNRSGAGLTWDYFFKGLERPALINHIEDRDLWKFLLPGTREIQAALFSYPYDFEVWDKLMNPVMIPDLLREGVGIERKHFKDIEELVKVCARWIPFSRTQDDELQYTPIASLPYTLTSDAGHLMCKMVELGELKDLDNRTSVWSRFAMCYWDTEDARIFSLRSLDTGADVSIIAQQYGGGGHKHAAGFSVPRAHYLAKI